MTSECRSVELPAVEVLIVSLCLAQRREVILRAIDSIEGQEGVKATPLIVVNGARFDRSLYDQLCQRPDVRVFYQKEPSIFLARRLAREQTGAPYFAMLDDDDELLPQALATRVGPLQEDATLDVVVSNGFLAEGAKETLILEEAERLQDDPLGRLMEFNWLPTASGLFRSRSVTPDYFDTTLRSNDMTYLAFRLGLDRRIRFLDTPTFRKHYSADSISLTDTWHLRSVETLEKMLAMDMPPAIRRKLRRKYGSNLHSLSDYYLHKRNLGQSWSYHLRSLAQPGGQLRYGAYTRKLIAAAFGIIH